MFQLPILQVIVNIVGLVSLDLMKNSWKYIILISTILGAIITPSTDPITQLILSSVILILYGIGILLIQFYNKK